MPVRQSSSSIQVSVSLWANETRMVGVAQLVEHPVVVRVVAGSTPVAHPKSKLDNLEMIFYLRTGTC